MRRPVTRGVGLTLVAWLALAGCATTDPVYLRHPTTGAVVQCGPYNAWGVRASGAVVQERGCIEDYQRQGYERTPSPTEPRSR